MLKMKIPESNKNDDITYNTKFLLQRKAGGSILSFLKDHLQ